ncbi:alpha,alpha-phosphotrehalase [Cytobacillus sp. IB215665]|uniref:alpha,alpha-phosphotrehalase n=1 Tax=Cytobacillus sp. IB215665 TaxID=3097357 RepID=UPI002A0D5331|nr:alpha,alpha-phosphotrehalase [Cytobacillus sp. IB215665]MDX8365856.1 alpha,alpha-phosphotrehalase [Cytobacillus sp. IB215665]
MKDAWWKRSVVYQIYPKSFKDTTGNGVGDLQGIISKLDYLTELGVDIIWLTPIYKSPQRDNGYDISDYFSIHEEYGTMADFDLLLTEAHKRNMKVIMDIVVNHTSTEHAWFKQSRESMKNKYRDFYIWHDDMGKEPNNWQSKFGNSAWELDDQTGQYYLHLFDITQADLNWENKQVREHVYEMMHFWFKKGVDGFRLDVINLISKDQQFPNDDITRSGTTGDGRKFYTDGPRVHEFIHEMNRQVFSKYDSMTVGEMSSTTIDHCIKYTNPKRQELDMTFNFHHLKVDYPNGEKWEVANFNFLQLKQILSTWQSEMIKGGGWNALFWCNHDQPRIVSRFGNDQRYHKESAKMLATTIHLMQGTPYIYQGEEIGMTNPNFDRIEDYRDVESLNIYKMKKNEGMKENEILNILKQKSRDNARTPIQWDNSKNAGFSKGKPWINVSANYKHINATEALRDNNSVFYHYKQLISLRKKYDIITYGDFQLILEDHPQIYAYVRSFKNEKLLVINNFYAKEATFLLPETVEIDGYSNSILLSNYNDSPMNINYIELRPYESIIYHLTK